MKVQVLGGPDRGNPKGKAPHSCSLSSLWASFLINETVAIDAGPLFETLPLTALMKLRYILLTHIHLDHIQSLPYVAEALFGKIHSPITILSIKEIINPLKKHFFNDQISPDFTRLPTKENGIFRYQTIKADQAFILEKMRFTAIRVNHAVPAIGFILKEDHASIVISGDTGKTDQIWKVAQVDPNLKAAFIETSFPNRLEKLARDSGHLTPRLAGQEFKKLNHPEIPFHPYHIKSFHLQEIANELKEIKAAKLLDGNQSFEF